ncbi:MAG: hypothetical protein V3U87_07925 [Methylococcaceae bacterium]
MTEENQPAPQDPALDAFASAGYQIEGYNSTVPKEDEATATSKEGEVKNEVGNESHLTQGETPTSTNENTETEENTETKTQGQNDSFDESKYLEEISNSRFKTREELAEAISRSEQYDQLRDAYDKLEDHEPEFANSLVRELNSFVANGGDANTFINLVATDFDEMSEVDIVAAQMIAHNPNLTAKEASAYVIEKYKLDEDTFTEKEVGIGKIDLGMQASKARQEFQDIKKSVIDESNSGVNYEEWNEKNLDNWNESLTQEVFSIEKLEFELPDNLGTFEYQVTEQERDKLDDDVYDLIDEVGMEYNAENLEKAKQIAADTYFLQNKEKIINSIVQSAVSKVKEGSYKESHNPSPLPTEDTPNRDGEPLSREDMAAKLISRNW